MYDADGGLLGEAVYVWIPLDLLHLNEMPPDVSAAVAACGAPVVLARLDAHPS